jgi:hypothetical protein
MFAKITKTVIGALVLTSVSFAVTASAYSTPRQAPSQTNESYKKDRHNPTDTNGKRPAPPPVVLPGDGRT